MLSQRSREARFVRLEVPGTLRAPCHNSTETGTSPQAYCAACAIDSASPSEGAETSYGNRKRPEFSTKYIRYWAIDAEPPRAVEPKRTWVGFGCIKKCRYR